SGCRSANRGKGLRGRRDAALCERECRRARRHGRYIRLGQGAPAAARGHGGAVGAGGASREICRALCPPGGRLRRETPAGGVRRDPVRGGATASAVSTSRPSFLVGE